MTKRSADEALVHASSTNNEDVAVANNAQNSSKEPNKPSSSPSPSESGKKKKNKRPLLPHRVSSLSSSSSSSSLVALNSKQKISSSSDHHNGAAPTEKYYNATTTTTSTRKQQPLTRLTNARILQRDGTLPHGSMTIDPSSGIILEIDLVGQSSSGTERVVVDASDDSDSIIQEEEEEEEVVVVDCQGYILSPGFIDIQLNGAYGIDFSNDCGNHPNNEDSNQADKQQNQQQQGGLDTKDVLHVANRLVETGVTSFCPTMISSSPRTYRHILPLMRNARKEQRNNNKSKSTNINIGANILGMHLEGPFFAPSKRGAHNLQHIVAPMKGLSSVKEIYGINNKNTNQNDDGDDHFDNNNSEESLTPQFQDIDIVTLAPELQGALEVTQSLTTTTTTNKKNDNDHPAHPPHPHPSHAIVISCGHTEATYEDGIRALSHGATLLTHLLNAMNPFHHRKPGLAGLLSSQAKLECMGLQRPFYSMIVDGIHVHESAVNMAYRSHPRGCVLVTDAMTAMGLGDGEHMLGTMNVCIRGDRATLAGTDTLAGSVVSMDTCVKRFHKFTGCTLGEALLCATLHPAMVLGRHQRNNTTHHSVSREWKNNAPPIGILEVGAKADLVMLNDDLDVIETWVGGRSCFSKERNNKR